MQLNVPYDIYPFDPSRGTQSGALSASTIASEENGKLFFDEVTGSLCEALTEEFESRNGRNRHDEHRNTLTDLNWVEFDRRLKEDNPAILLPIGSLEQHGPHSPNGSDEMTTRLIAEEVARRV